ncbi:Dyp-type peroxidase [Priestia megaterium]|uniref:Dyp-type peroxidase n=1 Tax=Priestia megaterium TaxID=1404 RepID=UPI001C527C0C|nr:Dyp-type peroxidase [Priestia megaterium]MBW0931381.1 Dyp-type peroxidase [Priestia megaterium]
MPDFDSLEPVLDAKEIQGNSLAGFNKDHQCFLFFEINDVKKAKSWISSLISSISTLEEVACFNRLYRQIRHRQEKEPFGLVSTWMNIAFSYRGLNKLTPESNQFSNNRQNAFPFGMENRSGLLGDQNEGSPDNWVLGGKTNNPDIVLIIASDVESYMVQSYEQILNEASADSGVRLVFKQIGKVRQDKKGHEHFGFSDGVSQPAPRGRLSNTEGDFLTARVLEPDSPHSLDYAKPGHQLVCAGQFVLGYARDNRDDPNTQIPYDPSLAPSWAVNGSYMVIRRLKQDVAGFWSFVKEQADELEIPYEKLASLMVGRWPSGAPIMRTPEKDIPSLGKDDYANNHFNYSSLIPNMPVLPSENYPGDHYPPQITNDFLGQVCPHAAHIRKMNPRDLGVDSGSTRDTLKLRMIRRGIPYGDPLIIKDYSNIVPDQEDRGLMFVSYQSSIEDTFEFLTSTWANEENLPNEGGHDPIIGQNDEASDRHRIFKWQDKSITINKDFVIPTGGEYFFQPSITALKTVITKE